MRPRAVVALLFVSAWALAPTAALAQAANTAYASDNPGGPASPNSIDVKVDVTAQVGTVCSVISGGTAGGAGTFGDSVNLDNVGAAGGKIVNANGTVRTDLNTSTSAAASVAQTYQINCTGTNDAITLKATPLATAIAAPTGYANTVNYTAEADFAVTGGTSPVKLTDSSDSTTHNGLLGSGVKLANAAGDILIKAYAFNTSPNPGNVLVAGAYQGVITVTITAGT